MRLAPAFVVAAALCRALPASAAAPESTCVTCHTSIRNPPIVASHVAEWLESKHGEKGVGCERCHGGEPTMTQAPWAHRGVLHSSALNSPVNRANLFRTCAPCHAAQAGAFSKSMHRVMLDVDASRAPSCSTCHGGMDLRVPDPAVLEARCAECHRPGSLRADYPREARLAIEEITRLRATLDEWSPEIAATADAERRRSMRAAWDAAYASTSAAVTAFHMFDLTSMKAALDAARSGTEGVRQEFER